LNNIWNNKNNQIDFIHIPGGTGPEAYYTRFSKLQDREKIEKKLIKLRLQVLQQEYGTMVENKK
jgi:hypothetical protein